MTHRLRVLQNELDREMLVAVAATSVYGAAVTCSRGCHACCSQQVLATKPEAHAILEAVDKQGGRAALRQLVQRCRAQLADLGPTADDPHVWLGRTRCVLLNEQGECSVYRERPATCRTYLVVSPPELCKGREVHVARIDATLELGRFYQQVAGEHGPVSFELLPRLLLRLAKRHGTRP